MRRRGLTWNLFPVYRIDIKHKSPPIAVATSANFKQSEQKPVPGNSLNYLLHQKKPRRALRHLTLRVDNQA